MTIQTARHLRKTLTPQEVKIWNHLRTWRSQGFHFRRQAPRLGYIVDFICLKHHLVVEIDGGQHNVEPHRAIDKRRDKKFERAVLLSFVSGIAMSMEIWQACWKQFKLR